MVIHLTTILFQFHHPEDGLITGRNMLMKVLEIKKQKCIIKLRCIFWLRIYILQIWLIHGIWNILKLYDYLQSMFLVLRR